MEEIGADAARDNGHGGDRRDHPGRLDERHLRTLPSRGKVIEAASMRRADIVCSTSLRLASASTERCEALMTATGFPRNSSLETSQSWRVRVPESSSCNQDSQVVRFQAQ